MTEFSLLAPKSVTFLQYVLKMYLFGKEIEGGEGGGEQKEGRGEGEK